jgi:phosphoribosylamine-glycine ligase
MEEKKLFAGGVGPNTGCMGNVVWHWTPEISEYLYDTLFKSLEPALRNAKYLGPLDINAIWTPNGPYGLEWTARFGYDAIQAYSRLLDVPFADFLHDLRQLSEIPVSDLSIVAAAIRVSAAPWPNDGVEQVPVSGIRKAMLPNLYFYDVMQEDGELHCTGADGYIVSIANHGKLLGPVLRKIYSIAEEIEIPAKQYRVDIGDRVPADKRRET